MSFREKCDESVESSTLSKSQRTLARFCLWGLMIIMLLIAIIMLIIFFLIANPRNTQCFTFPPIGPCTLIYVCIGMAGGIIILLLLWAVFVFCADMYWCCTHR